MVKGDENTFQVLLFAWCAYILPRNSTAIYADLPEDPSYLLAYVIYIFGESFCFNGKCSHKGEECQERENGTAGRC